MMDRVESSITVPAEFRARLISQSPAARPWLDELPGLLVQTLGAWRLSLIGAPRFGGTSVVVPVQRAEGRRAALKLVSPVADAAHEAKSLQVLKGAGVVELYEYNPRHCALLLELLDGARGSERADSRRMAEICGGVAAEIASVPAPADAPSLRAGAPAWRMEFGRQHARAEAEGRGLPRAVFRRAEDAIAELEGASDARMTHGDLSFDNLIQRPDGTWLSIDPKYVCGPAENEAHTVVRSVPWCRLDGTDPVTSSRLLIEAFCSAGGLDAGLAMRISHARFAASYYWETEHGGDARNVEWLRLMTGGT